MEAGEAAGTVRSQAAFDSSLAGMVMKNTQAGETDGEKNSEVGGGAWEDGHGEYGCGCCWSKMKQANMCEMCLIKAYDSRSHQMGLNFESSLTQDGLIYFKKVFQNAVC